MKKPKMWRRGKNGGWYVTVNQEQISLGRDETEAQQRYEQLLGANGLADIQRVDDLLDVFLGWVKKNRAAMFLKVDSPSTR